MILKLTGSHTAGKDLIRLSFAVHCTFSSPSTTLHSMDPMTDDQ